VQHSFYLSHEFHQTPESILQRAQQSIDDTSKKQLLEDMMRCCKKQIGKSTFYAHRDEDEDLKRLWELRVDYKKRRDFPAKPTRVHKQSYKELEKKNQMLMEENTSLTRENKELKSKVEELGDRLTKILLTWSIRNSEVSSTKVDDQSNLPTSEPLSCISYPDNLSLQEGIS